MKSEFLSIAQRIAEASAHGGLTVAQIGEIARSQLGEINCYPGEPTGRCHELALFIALRGQLRNKKKGHYHCSGIFEEMVRHMQGACPEVTRHAVLILDHWWEEHYEKWRPNIEAMKRDGIRFEAYLIGVGCWAAPLPI